MCSSWHSSIRIKNMFVLQHLLPYKTIQSFSEIRSNEVNWKGFDLGVFGLIIPAAFSLLQVTSPKK